MLCSPWRGRNRRADHLEDKNDRALPQAGALVVVTFPKPLDGSGFPARVFAIVP
jgi:kynurenine formamidase